MPIYEYKCICGKERDVHKTVAKRNDLVTCECGLHMERILSMCNIAGTRDSFGIKNEFYSHKAKKYIDNWRAWEKAGYRSVKDSPMSSGLKNEIKEKIKKRKGIPKMSDSLKV